MTVMMGDDHDRSNGQKSSRKSVARGETQMWGWRLAVIMAAGLMSGSAAAQDFLAGGRLYDDVRG